MVVTIIVLLDADGYGDVVDGIVSVTDAIYYATVAVTTTGYGDIAPVSDRARVVTALVVTPIRIAFPILVVGTTMEVLTDRWRDGIRQARCRERMTDHFIICGYGTKGHAAAVALIAQGHDAQQIVVVDRDPGATERARRDGFAVVKGDATRSAVLADAEVAVAKGLVVALDRDDTAVLVTLTARDLNADLAISASSKVEENTRLLSRSGADSVVTADEATGRLLGMALTHPAHVSLLEDLLSAGEGLELGRPTTTTTRQAWTWAWSVMARSCRPRRRLAPPAPETASCASDPRPSGRKPKVLMAVPDVFVARLSRSRPRD